jgi:hypothetical protein
LVDRWGRQCGSSVVDVLTRVIDCVANPAAGEELLKAWFAANKPTATYPWAGAAPRTDTRAMAWSDR